MDEKEGMNSSGVAVKGDDASESFRVEPSVENPSQFSGSAATSTEAAPISDAAPATETKKKRGRPRKYGPDGSISMALSPMPISASIPLTGDFSAWKQSRGRPIDSYKKKHKLELESSVQTGVAYSVGANFIPHVITVNAGEDVTMKIISFSQQGSRAICVLAANGSISNVTLHQPNSSGGTLTYEGRFEILSLTGLFMPSDNGVTKSRSGGMSVSLAGPDGRVLGGGLAGMLIAAGAVQVVIGSFLPGHQQEQKPKKQKFEKTAAYAAIPAQPLSDERAEGACSAPKPSLTSAASFHPPPNERAEGAYSAPKPSLTSAASFHEDDVVSINAMHTKISTPDSIISAPAAEYKDQGQSKCEVSC